MKVVVLGAGGLGLLVAGYLARDGHEVVVVGKDEQVAALAKGIEVSGPDSFRAAVQAVSQLSDGGQADYLIVAVKTRNTPDALERVGQTTFRGVLSLQNGGVKNQQLADIFGWPSVIGAATMLGATLLAPGLTARTLNGTTYFGELSGGQSERVELLSSIFNHADLKAQVPESIQSVEWSKLCRIVPAGLLSALTRLEFYKVNRNPDLAWLFVAMTRECAAVAEAAGAGVGDYEGLAVRSLAYSVFDDAVASVVERGVQMERSGQTAAKISMLQDVLKGRKTEVEETAGYVVARAHEHGIAVPNVEFGYRAVRGMESFLD